MAPGERSAPDLSATGRIDRATAQGSDRQRARARGHEAHGRQAEGRGVGQSQAEVSQDPLRLMGVSKEAAGQIELVPDDDGRGGVTVMMDGSPQSHVSLADPAILGFEYIAAFAAVIDTLPTGPLGVTHIGGAGLTLARYVNAERPGSPQIVLEPNIELT